MDGSGKVSDCHQSFHQVTSPTETQTDIDMKSHYNMRSVGDCYHLIRELIRLSSDGDCGPVSDTSRHAGKCPEKVAVQVQLQAAVAFIYFNIKYLKSSSTLNYTSTNLRLMKLK